MLRLLVLTTLVVATMSLACWWLVLEVRAGSKVPFVVGKRSRVKQWAYEQFLRHDPVVLVIAALTVIVALALVLATPVKGLADNGDWERLMFQMGLAPSPGHPLTSGQLNEHLVRVSSRAALPIPAEVANSPSVFNYYFHYLSSELGLIQVALLLHNVTGSHVIDIRWIGFVNLLPVLLGFGALVVASRRLRPVVRRLTVFLTALAFIDPGYLLYLNSVYSEPASLGFLLIAVGAGLAVYACRRPHFAFWTFVFATACFTLAKSDDALPSLVLAVAAVPLASRAYPGGWRSSARQWAASVGALTVLAAVVWDFAASLQYFTFIHEYDSVFVGILPHTPDKAAALRSLNLPPDLISYSGYAAFDRQHSAFVQPFIHKEFFDRMSMGKVLLYYLSHPADVWRAISYSSGQASDLRLGYLGNLATGSGAYAPHTPWTSFHRHLPHDPAILLVPLAAIGVAARRLWRKREATQWIVVAAIAAVGLVSFVQSPLTEGTEELTKHDFLFNVCFDLVVLALAAAVFSVAAQRLVPETFAFADIAPHLLEVRGAIVPQQRAETDTAITRAAPSRSATSAETSVGSIAAGLDDPATTAAETPASTNGRARIVCPVCDESIVLAPVIDGQGRRVVSCAQCGNVVVLSERGG